MEALIELCDIIAQNPSQFSDKISWICSLCPPSDSLIAGSHRISKSQLNAVLAVARFLSKCSGPVDPRFKSVVLEFFCSIPASFNKSFWPQSFGVDAIASFFVDFLGYVSNAGELSPDFANEIEGLTIDIVVSAISYSGGDLSISRAFLTALSQSFPPILSSDAEKLATLLLDQLVVTGVTTVQSPATPTGRITANSETSSSQSSPLSVNNGQPNGSTSSANEASNLVGSSAGTVAFRVGDDTASTSSRGSVTMNGSMGNFGFNEGSEALMVKQQVSFFEEESVESLEKQEVAFKLIAHILDKLRVDTGLLEQVRLIAKRQLQSMIVFLKVWSLLLVLLILKSVLSVINSYCLSF